MNLTRADGHRRDFLAVKSEGKSKPPAKLATNENERAGSFDLIGRLSSPPLKPDPRRTYPLADEGDDLCSSSLRAPYRVKPRGL